MEREYQSRLQKNEIMKTASKRILIDSLLLASRILGGKKNVWELVSKGIVDKDDELVKCVGILTDNPNDEDLKDIVQNTFESRYSFLMDTDFVDIVEEYSGIKDWLDNENSKV